ncbi:MAG: TIGR03067 domain-containing protein [Acidobacteriia bacterium]|nr:TIGR03067 domain-containing protein [Terriglobia bacterium]
MLPSGTQLVNKRQDLDLLQGCWTVIAMELDGEKTAAAMLADACIEIQGDRFTSTGMGAVYQGTLLLDTSANPWRIDMKFDAGPEKGNTNLGIYELDGDTWKLCLATRGRVRPSRFASTGGSGFALEVLARGKELVTRTPPASTKAAASSASTAPITELEGDWQMASGIFDGKPMDQSLVEWVKRNTTGNLTTVIAGPNVMLKAEFTTDPSKSPKAIDYFNLAGSNKGKTQLGIYQIEGELLKVHIAAPGAPRPKTFEPAKVKGDTLTVWKRA